MKTLLPVLMFALSLITSAVRAKIPQEATMKLSSPDFGEGGNIPERFTCDGKDITPTLKIDGVPKEAKSLVLIVDDLDAPAGNFTHWLMWNVVPDLTEIVANRPPSHAVQGVNDFEKANTVAHSRHRAYIATILSCTPLTRRWPYRRRRNVRPSIPQSRVTLSPRRL
jgi:phosphatidylethanolamine-binding protein (PEBP) family uncharacterized protein